MAHKYCCGDKTKAPRADYQETKKYIPSLEVGEYEQYKKKQIKKGGLYLFVCNLKPYGAFASSSALDQI